MTGSCQELIGTGSRRDQGCLVSAARAATGVDLGRVTPHRTHRLVLDGNMATYRWTINGRTMHGGAPLKVRNGERARLVFDNRSTMFHPMPCTATPFNCGVPDPVIPGPARTP